MAGRRLLLAAPEAAHPPQGPSQSVESRGSLGLSLKKSDGLTDSLLTLEGKRARSLKVHRIRGSRARSSHFSSPILPCLECPHVPSAAVAPPCLFTKDWLEGDGSLDVDSAIKKASQKQKTVKPLPRSAINF